MYCLIIIVVFQVIGNKELPNYITYLYKGLKSCYKHLEEMCTVNDTEGELHGFALKVSPVSKPVLTVSQFTTVLHCIGYHACVNNAQRRISIRLSRE